MAHFSLETIGQLHAASRNYSQSYAAPYVHRADILSRTIFDDLVTNVSSEGQGDITIPSVGEYAVHLELLESFGRLREAVIRSNQLDVLFDTMPQKNYITTTHYSKGFIIPRKNLQKPIKQYDTTFQERRKEKWVRFVDCAFVRFRSWAAAVSRHHHEAMPNETDHLAARFVPPLGIASFHKPNTNIDLR